MKHFKLYVVTLIFLYISDRILLATCDQISVSGKKQKNDEASNLDWFPRLRAMSLAAVEGDGEQIEFRSLQSQLETTQILVTNLSQQLMELKDQMAEQRKQKQRLGFLNSASAYSHSSNLP